jgi:hypothetical protein
MSYLVTVTIYTRLFRGNKGEFFARNTLKITADNFSLTTPHLLLKAFRDLADIRSNYSALHRRRVRQSRESAYNFWLSVGHPCLYILNIAGVHLQSSCHFAGHLYKRVAHTSLSSYFSHVVAADT